jgi:hypothetical protein
MTDREQEKGKNPQPADEGELDEASLESVTGGVYGDGGCIPGQDIGSGGLGDATGFGAEQP